MNANPIPPSHKDRQIPPPKSIKELPQYLRTLLGGFFYRFAYVVKLVWDTGHWILFLLTFMAVFKGITPIIGSLISKNILNELQLVLKNGPMEVSAFWTSPVFYLLIFLFVYRVLLQIVNTLSRSLNRIAGELVVKQVKLQMMEKAKELDLGSFDDPDFYERMENANREAGTRPLMVLTETFGLVSTIIEFISYLVILLAVPDLVWATLLILVVSVPSAVVNFIYRKKNFQYMRHRSRERREMNYFSQLLVNKDLFKEVRLYDLGDTFIARFMGAFRAYYKGLRKLIIGETGWHTAISIVSGITNLVFYILVAIKVFAGEIMIGDYNLYSGAVVSLATCVTALITASGTIYEGTLFVDNLIAFMKEKRTVLPTLAEPLPVAQKTGHTVVFDNVSFRYPGMRQDVLKNVSFTIHPGETMALVGLNGAGKTTLIKLLTRLYDPTEGTIYLDGKDIRCYDLESLYSAFGIIFQDFGKYAVSVAENIRYGDLRKPMDMDGIQRAAEQSAAAEYIRALPRGYDTPLMRIFEKDGMELSIGQWQKLAVARAFYADSEIFILDEPTASLDAIAEQEIFNQFDKLRGGKTTIFVSHRLSSATMANQILVLENGQVIEQGTHEALMALEGKYFKLFNTQAQRYRDPAPENRPPFGHRPPRPRPDF
ncbi:MAG: ABC transporter ATP-binding protein [Oscillospiraceae bacterium]|nr:ABC transporter ATP-binding protein [Oscillospiraceae bacterium]